MSVGPHFRDGSSTSRIMLDVLIALIPAFAASVIFFGPRALLVTCVCVAACVLFEALYQKLLKKPVTVGDYSACITGVLLAFNLPVTIPLWQAVVGCAVAIILVKQLFGGLGKNFANPAITARVFMFLAFAGAMTTWDAPPIWSIAPDAVTGPTPLALLGAGNTDALPGVWDMILGLRGGTLGETSVLALVIGGIYLMIRRVVSWHTPVVYIACVPVFALLLGQDPLYHTISGGLFLGAVFMATDYVTAPQTNKGRIVMGIGAAFFTMVIRVYSNYPEGVSFAILIMNILTPYINRFTATKPLGGIKNKN